jgi:hypothetical protein
MNFYPEMNLGFLDMIVERASFAVQKPSRAEICIVFVAFHRCRRLIALLCPQRISSRSDWIDSEMSAEHLRFAAGTRAYR